MNVLMQLRKVCNHPDLFDTRSKESPFFQQEHVAKSFPAIVWKAFKDNAHEKISFQGLRFVLSELEDVSKRDFNQRKALFP